MHVKMMKAAKMSVLLNSKINKLIVPARLIHIFNRVSLSMNNEFILIID